MSGQANRDSNERAKTWVRACERYLAIGEQLRLAQKEVDAAGDELGKHLAPEDAEVNEEFQIWIRTDELGFFEKEKLLRVTKLDSEHFAIRWRNHE